jgi:hypothetical protein
VADLLFVLTRSTVNYSLIAYQARRRAGGPHGLDPKVRRHHNPHRSPCEPH